jgi:glycerol-3-phosphate cytidylyltransferase
MGAGSSGFLIMGRGGFMAIVYTGGTFDLLHAGHVDLLRVCRKVSHGGEVIVGLNRDAFVHQFKGKPPVCSYEERRDILLACRYVDAVIPNIGDTDSKPAILHVKPDFILIGDDWAVKDYYAQMNFTPEWLDDNNISLLYVPRQRRLSSTAIKSRIEGKTYEQLGVVALPAE